MIESDDCGPLSPPLNGQIFIGNTTTGNVAAYLCDSGFLLVNSNESRVCGADGLWSGDEPTCEGTISTTVVIATFLKVLGNFL